MSKPEKPPIVRPQSWGDNRPRGKDMKDSILKDVDEQIVHNESGKSGGS